MKITNKTVAWAIILVLIFYPLLHLILFGIDFEKEVPMGVWFILSCFLFAGLGVWLLISLLYNEIQFEYQISLPWKPSEKDKELAELYRLLASHAAIKNEPMVNFYLDKIEKLDK